VRQADRHGLAGLWRWLCRARLQRRDRQRFDRADDGAPNLLHRTKHSRGEPRQEGHCHIVGSAAALTAATRHPAFAVLLAAVLAAMLLLTAAARIMYRGRRLFAAGLFLAAAVLGYGGMLFYLLETLP
jgi:hypothetical protein